VAYLTIRVVSELHSYQSRQVLRISVFWKWRSTIRPEYERRYAAMHPRLKKARWLKECVYLPVRAHGRPRAGDGLVGNYWAATWCWSVTIPLSQSRQWASAWCFAALVGTSWIRDDYIENCTELVVELQLAIASGITMISWEPTVAMVACRIYLVWRCLAPSNSWTWFSLPAGEYVLLATCNQGVILQSGISGAAGVGGIAYFKVISLLFLTYL